MIWNGVLARSIVSADHDLASEVGIGPSVSVIEPSVLGRVSLFGRLQRGRDNGCGRPDRPENFWHAYGGAKKYTLLFMNSLTKLSIATAELPFS